MNKCKNMENHKITMFHFTCYKTGGHKEVPKQKTKKKRPEKESKKSNISFDVLQNTRFFINFTKGEKGSKLQNTTFHRPAPAKPGDEKSNISFDFMQNMIFHEKIDF